MNMIAKVKLIFYAIVVFSIYLYAIFYSFGDHEPILSNKTTKQTADSSSGNFHRESVNIEFVLLDSTGKPIREADVFFKNNQTKGEEKGDLLKIKTSLKGEVELLNIEPGPYLIYLEENHSRQKQISISSSDDGKSITLTF
jgi:hypothetical protein